MRLFLIKCLSLLFCAFAFTCGPLGTAGLVPGTVAVSVLVASRGLAVRLPPGTLRAPWG